MKRPTEVKLTNPPEDIISSVKFGPKTNQYLLGSSWDGTLRFYDVTKNAMRQKFVTDSPILDCAFMVRIHSYFLCIVAYYLFLGYCSCCLWLIG